MTETKRTNKGSRKRPNRVSRLIPAAIVVCGFGLFFALGLNEYLSFDALRAHRQNLIDWASNRPLASAFAYIGIYALVVALSIPGAVWLTIAGCFVFGWAMGTIFTVVGATLGACGIFMAARYAFADYFREKAGPRLRRMEDGFRENAASYLLFLRLVPVFPFWLVNLGPAFFGIPLGTFAFWTFIGIIPGSFVYVLVGNGVGKLLEAGQEPDLGIIFQPHVLAPILGLAVLSLVPIVIKRLRQRSGATRSIEQPVRPADGE